MKIYDYTSGYCTTEQDFITILDTFLVSTITGWTRVEAITDLPSDRDYAWMSTGETPENNGNIFIRIRGYNNNIYMYGYGIYISSVSYADEMYNASYTYLPTNGYPIKYWVFGDKNFVCFTILNTSTMTTHTGYCGLIRSYYVPATDPLPLLIRGHATDSNSWSSSAYAYMFNATTSGVQSYTGYNWSTLLTNDYGTRNTDLVLLPIMLDNTNTGAHEVRGEPYGVFQVNANRIGTMAPIVTASGIFIAFRHGASSYVDRTYAYGPVATASGIDNFNI